MRTKNKRDTLLRSFIFRSMAGILATLALIGLGACASQSNEQSVHPVADAFDRADTNHDGQLSKNEASDYLVNKIFDSRDANHDDKMTPEEWTGGDPARMAQFKKRDANNDGIVTKQEAEDYGRAHGVVNQIMKEADTNHDGQLSRAEVQAYYGSREGPPN